MMPQTTAVLLPLSARLVVRRLALQRLEDWGRARSRLDDPADAEALHDFRVALRRLRSLIRAFRPACDDLVPRRIRRRLRRLADATGEGRDLEVQRTWLLGRVARLTPRQRSGARWLLSQLEPREAQASERLRRQVEKRFADLHAWLWTSFASEDGARAENGETAPLSARAVVRQALEEWTGDLEYHLHAIHGISDEGEAHTARILVKRLRYLLEPFQTEVPSASDTIRRLTGLQDLLGDLHDLHRIATELQVAFHDAAVRHADLAYRELLPWGEANGEAALLRPPGTTGGLAALAKLLRSEAEALFARLKSEWLDGGAADGLRTELHRLGDILEDQHPVPGIEIERKYLLSALPPHALSYPKEEIEQGWLPGKQLVERLRHVRSGDGDAWYRTVKSGQGIQRIEIEEAATRELFEALWPLTEGCRVRKRRYLVPEGTVLWEVDQFLDRELVLAETELPRVDTPVAIPGWIAECLVREVTGEGEYVNRQLAK